MPALEELIARILKSFCHVEWHEVGELATLVKSGGAKFDVDELRAQFERLLDNPNGSAAQINRLTGEEFESDEDARVWLLEIYRKVF